jgi:hypothetical protein
VNVPLLLPVNTNAHPPPSLHQFNLVKRKISKGGDFKRRFFVLDHHDLRYYRDASQAECVAIGSLSCSDLFCFVSAQSLCACVRGVRVCVVCVCACVRMCACVACACVRVCVFCAFVRACVPCVDVRIICMYMREHFASCAHVCVPPTGTWATSTWAQ